MKKTFTFIAILSAFVLGQAHGDMTTAERLELLPLPNGAKVERTFDFAKEPSLEFSKKHNDFFALDPFGMERETNKIPEYSAIRFTTTESPREAYLFYKLFFNTEKIKERSKQIQPYYNSRSYFHFDEKGEADTSSDSTIGNAVFYRIACSAGKGYNAEIVIFKDNASNLTTVYIITYDKKS